MASRTASSSSLPCRLPSDSANIAGALVLPGRPRERSCAVVGSSDILRLDPRGPEIDAHSIIWRLNNAPTVGWEHAVGRRTSVRVVNHVPLEKWVRLARNRSALDRTADGDEYHSLLCAPEHTALGCVALHWPGIKRTLDSYRSAHESHRVSLASDTLHRWGARCNSELRGTSPSGGLLTVLLALASCASPVSLFGFWPFCCGQKSVNYKYFQGNRTRFVCCSRGRERMEGEYAFYRMLEGRGLLRLKSAANHAAKRYSQ